MKELFNDRLKRIEDLEDRRWMKEIINGVFTKLTEYTQDELLKLEQRVFDEVKDREEQYSVYTRLVPIEDYDPLDEIFTPMIRSDINQDHIDFMEIQEAMKRREHPVVTKIYLPLDYLELQRKLKEWQEQPLQGRLVTTSGSYEITLKTALYKGYLDQIEELYHLYVNNDIPWKTVLHPYASKFIQLELEEYPQLGEKETIAEVTFQLGELEQYQENIWIPCWNIEELKVRNNGFPLPVRDEVHYEHNIHLDQFGTEHGYLLHADAENIIYTRRTDAVISIAAAGGKVQDWKLKRIVHLLPKQKEEQFIGNHRTEVFTDRFARKENHTIRSMGEITRIMNTYPAAKELMLEQVEIVEQREEVEETYPMNPFLKDNIRTKEDKKVMQLYFKTSQFSEITRDKMSFLVSEMQLHFPEFKCVGALL